MSSTTSIHPDAVLQALLAKASRSNIKRTLIALHDICRKNHADGLWDFSLACIGRKANEAGLMSYRSLYNPTAQIYRDLIEAWDTYTGPHIALPAKTLASHEHLKKIPDPAVRMIMQGIIAERDSLKAHLNKIKGSDLGKGIIDKRPSSTTIVSNPGSGPTVVLMPDAQLNPAERDALKAAIEPAFLKGEGWERGPRGEIKNASGRTLFGHGFITAIQKVLGEKQPDVKVVS